MYHLKSRVVAKPLKDALELKSKMILPLEKNPLQIMMHEE